MDIYKRLVVKYAASATQVAHARISDTLVVYKMTSYRIETYTVWIDQSQITSGRHARSISDNYV